MSVSHTCLHVRSIRQYSDNGKLNITMSLPLGSVLPYRLIFSITQRVSVDKLRKSTVILTYLTSQCVVLCRRCDVLYVCVVLSVFCSTTNVPDSGKYLVWFLFTSIASIVLVVFSTRNVVLIDQSV